MQQDTFRTRFFYQTRNLCSVPTFALHQGNYERLWIMRLEIGGLVSKPGITDGTRLIECVLKSLPILCRVDNRLNRRCVKVQTVDGLVAHGVDHLAVHSVKVRLNLIHIDYRSRHD